MSKKLSDETILKSYNLWGTIGFVFNCFQSIFSELIFGLVNLYIFDVLITDVTKMYGFYGIMLLIAIYFIFLIPLWGYLMEKCVNAARVKLQERLIEKYFTGSLENLPNRHSSVLLSMLQTDVKQTAGLCGWDLVVMIQALISGILSICIIAILSFEIMFVLLGVGMIAIVCNYILTDVLHKYAIEVRKKVEKRLKVVVEFINNIVIIKVYNITSQYVNEIRRLSVEISKLKRKAKALETISNVVQDFIFNGIYKIVVVGMGLYYYQQGRISFGTIMFILSMSEGVAFLLSSISVYFKNIQEILVSKDIIDKFGEDVVENDIEEKKSEAVNIIEFRKINFSYSEDQNIIFENMDLVLRRESDYIILGDNASGKSTLFKILFGLYKPEKGEIYINNGQVDKNKKYNGIAFVPQEPNIFCESLIYNLLLENREFSESEIEKALKTVELLEWSNSLKDGLDTVLKEKGKDISKGQKIRIAIARALIKKPNFIIMDEIDSNIGMEMLNNLIINIKNNYGNCSIVAITHRAEAGIYKDFQKVVIKNRKCISCK